MPLKNSKHWGKPKKPAGTQPSGPRVDLKRMRILDFVLIAAILLGSAGALLGSIGEQKPSLPPAKEVIIYQDGTALQKLTLAGDREISLLGGRMVLEVREGKVRVKKSDCPRQFCVHQGWARHEGESIVCVPFKTLIEIQSNSEPVVDAVVY